MVAIGGIPGGLPELPRRRMEIGYDVGHQQTQDWMNELHANRKFYVTADALEDMDDYVQAIGEDDPDRARDVAYDDVDELEEHPDDYATFGDPDAAYDAYRDARDE